MNLCFHRWTQTIQLFGINKQKFYNYCILSVINLQAKIKWRIADRNFNANSVIPILHRWLILRIGRVAKASVNKIKSHPVSMSIWEQRRFKYPIVSGLKVPDFGRQFFRNFCSITKGNFLLTCVLLAIQIWLQLVKYVTYFAP